MPRWHFILKSYVFWSLLVFSVFLGSLSFSVIMHIMNLNDMQVYVQMHDNLIDSTVMMMPYFWLISIAIFSLVAYCNWKHTKLGYRFKRRWIVLSSVFLSAFIGSIMYVGGMGNGVDNLMSQNMNFYHESKRSARSEIWMHPENGFLVGKIVDFDVSNNCIIIKDENGKNWNVNDMDVSAKSKTELRKGKIVKIIGEKKDDNYFRASEIRRCGDCQREED